MDKSLLSVGVDVGTTTTQLIFSRLEIENRASGFAVPKLEIARRQVIYRSPIRFTPLVRGELVDGEAIRQWVEEEYQKAGIQRRQVDTGAIIVTGETSRKENAGAVLGAISDFAGDFVVATAGPDLESVLAAKGSGAVEYSRETGCTLVHVDIGGGTSNLALVEKGKILATACMNVGGRLIKIEDGKVCYISPVLEGLTKLRPGDPIDRNQAEEIAQVLVKALEMGVGLRPRDSLFSQLMTRGTTPLPEGEGRILSFSGGVADCIAGEKPWLCFGDLGPVLGSAIRKSRLCAGAFRLGEETVGATVIGAGSHSAQLSGSTVFYENVELPLKNLPVAAVDMEDLSVPALENAWQRLEGTGVLALEGWASPSYGQITALAQTIASAVGKRVCIVALKQDMAKALGSALKLRLQPGAAIVCLDGLELEEGGFLDIGAPVGPALPVVAKTLVLER